MKLPSLTPQPMKTPPILRNLVVSVTLSVASLATGDVVTDWNTAALNAIRASSTTPPQASRALAILHTSIYDAVNGIFRTHEPYFVKQKGPSNASEEAAASAAAHRVLITLFPTSAATFDQLPKPYWPEFETTRASDEASSGVNRWPIKSCFGDPRTGQARWYLPPPVAALGCGSPRRLATCRIYCRNGDS